MIFIILSRVLLSNGSAICHGSARETILKHIKSQVCPSIVCCLIHVVPPFIAWIFLRRTWFHITPSIRVIYDKSTGWQVDQLTGRPIDRSTSRQVDTHFTKIIISFHISINSQSFIASKFHNVTCVYRPNHSVPYTYTYRYRPTYIHIHIYTYTYTYIYMVIYICIYIYIYIYIHCHLSEKYTILYTCRPIDLSTFHLPNHFIQIDLLPFVWFCTIWQCAIVGPVLVTFIKFCYISQEDSSPLEQTWSSMVPRIISHHHWCRSHFGSRWTLVLRPHWRMHTGRIIGMYMYA